MESSDVLKAPPDSTNSDLTSNIQEGTDNDSGSAAQSNNSVSTSPSVSRSILFRDPYLPEDDGSILTPEHAFVQYQTRSEDQACQICGQPAVGFHHRAYVCEACKVAQNWFIVLVRSVTCANDPVILFLPSNSWSPECYK
ncbi:Nuclear receptor 2DBD gamma [Fasciola gigantica]|uniref:Nuclear receptor 2DBD gamma n=1 Tax=Fasciola gigantica TaxID=46835 RepID=A0A504YM65_FASGI|nr:Nuclear receptor 2DBD gamma [Fasciola gigantica]